MIIIAGSLSFDPADREDVLAFGERNLQRITGATASFYEAAPTAPVGVPAAG